LNLFVIIVKRKKQYKKYLISPPQQEDEEAIDKIFDGFSIAPKARLDIIFDIEGQQFDNWSG